MWTEKKLDEMLTSPSDRLVSDIAAIDDDIMVLGAGGKMGPTLCLLAQHAMDKTGKGKHLYAVSRFSDKEARKELEDEGVIVIPTDLQNAEEIAKLPQIGHIIMMVGRKFGTDGNECETWGMNAAVPTLICEHFTHSTMVVFSSGNVYPIVPAVRGGSLETDKVRPIGEYTQSCLARERIFEYYSRRNKNKVLIFRLDYSIALRYGVLADIAWKVQKEEPLSLSNGCFNCIWQGDANEFALRSLLLAQNPPQILNVTGPEIGSVRATACEIGRILRKEPVFEGSEETDSYLENSTKMTRLLGYPHVSLGQMIEWQAQWILDGGDNLNKPTHFEERKGSY